MSTVIIFVYELPNKLLHNCIFAAGRGGGLGARTRKKKNKIAGGGGDYVHTRKKNLKSSGKKETSGKSKLPSVPSKKNDLAITFKKLSKFCSVQFCFPLLVLLSISRIVSPTPRIKYPYSGLFWSASSRTWAEYGKIRSISPYSVRMWENADQNNSEYVHFSRSTMHSKKVNMRESWKQLVSY